MAAKAVKLEIPFQKLLAIIEQLAPDERLMLKKKLERENVTTWQVRFGRSLKALCKKNAAFTEKEVSANVSAAISEVRAGAGN
jgi:hypothetical protein